MMFGRWQDCNDEVLKSEMFRLWRDMLLHHTEDGKCPNKITAQANIRGTKMKIQIKGIHKALIKEKRGEQ